MRKVKKLYGKLDAFFEQGTEGIYPTLCKDAEDTDTDRYSYDRLIVLDNGDLLVVYDKDGAKLWQGIIKHDNPHINGMSHSWNGFHWIQEGVESKEDWGRMFLNDFRAMVIKNFLPVDAEGILAIWED